MKSRMISILFFLLLLGACTDENLIHTLTVTNGTGTGTYQAGEDITITANPPVGAFEVFSTWTGDTQFLNNPDTSPATVTMPLQDVLLEATYTTLPKFNLTVVSGQGGGQYFEGEVITITADTAPSAEQVFSEWIGDINNISEVKAPITDVTMPAQDISVEAVYVNLPKYILEVMQGIGSGSYLEGARIQISATAPGDNFDFTGWVGDTMHLDDAGSSSTVVTMPSEAVSVQAQFEEQQAMLISFDGEILPLFKRRCVDGGCHTIFHSLPLNSHEDIKNNISSIREETGPSGTMPYFTKAEIDLFEEWISQGALNN